MFFNRRRIVSLSVFAALTAFQVVALTRPATACPMRFTFIMGASKKAAPRVAEAKARVITEETTPAVRGKLISVARRSAPKLTSAALQRKTTAVASAAPHKNSVQR